MYGHFKWRGEKAEVKAGKTDRMIEGRVRLNAPHVSRTNAWDQH
jgi:hypothetical protein